MTRRWQLITVYYMFVGLAQKSLIFYMFLNSVDLCIIKSLKYFHFHQAFVRSADLVSFDGSKKAVLPLIG